MDSDAMLAVNATHAMSRLLTDRLGDLQADQIVLSRDEAALCLGLVNSLLNIAKQETGRSPSHAAAKG